MSIGKSDSDPLDLAAQIQEFKLQKGDWVIWSNRLLHEARKIPPIDSDMVISWAISPITDQPRR